MQVDHELGAEDGHDKVNLVQPLDDAALRVLDQLVPDVELVQPDDVHLKLMLCS